MTGPDEVEDTSRLLDISQDVLTVLSEDGTIRYVNDAITRVLGYDVEAITGDVAFEFIHPEDRDRVIDRFDTLRRNATRETEGIEYRVQGADGSWVWLESRMSNECDTAIGGYVVSSRDITDRKRTEAEHETVRSYLEELAANSNDVLWMFTADWDELLFVNEAYEDVYGGSIERLRQDSMAFVETIHPDDRPAVRDAMESISAGNSDEMEYRVNEAEQYGRWVWVKAQPIVENDEVVRVVGFSRDVTGRRRRERQLRIMDRMLRHNLRNEMNVVIGHAEELASKVGEEAEQHTGPIAETARRLLTAAEKERAVVKQLLDRHPLSTLDVSDVVGEQVRETRDAWPDADIDTSIPEEAFAFAVPTLGLAVGELVENGIEHAQGADPTVEVSVTVETDRVGIEIADRCPPIPPQEIAVLSGEADEDDVFHGSGLGLWLVHLIVDLSNGDLTFDTGDGGNVVTIWLDRAESVDG